MNIFSKLFGRGSGGGGSIARSVQALNDAAAQNPQFNPNAGPNAYGSIMRTVDAAESLMKKGGRVKKMASGGSASKRADGCAIKGKTRGKIV